VNPKYAKHLQGMNILLIDDVLTTGATLNACAIALKDAGANQVYALTLTKRLLEDSFGNHILN
ncbi:MAG: ComF family protein, partial [Flammeovirgaceae bacterium]